MERLPVRPAILVSSVGTEGANVQVYSGGESGARKIEGLSRLLPNHPPPLRRFDTHQRCSMLCSTPSQLTHSMPAHTVQFPYVLHVQPLYAMHSCSYNRCTLQPPVTQSAWSRRNYVKIGDCEQWELKVRKVRLNFQLRCGTLRGKITFYWLLRGCAGSWFKTSCVQARISTVGRGAPFCWGESPIKLQAFIHY